MAEQIIYFPSIFKKMSTGYKVKFPNFNKSIKCSTNIDIAYNQAVDTLDSILMELGNEEYPTPATPDTLKVSEGEQIILLRMNLEHITNRINGKKVKKTLNIPSWLNDFGVSNNINFSNVLTQALLKKLFENQ